MVPILRISTSPARLRRAHRAIRSFGRTSGSGTRADRARTIAISGLRGTSNALTAYNEAVPLLNQVVGEINDFTDEMYKELAAEVEAYLKGPASPWPRGEGDSRSQFSTFYDAKNRVIKVYNSATHRGYRYVHRWEFGPGPYKGRIQQGVQRAMLTLGGNAVSRALAKVNRA